MSNLRAITLTICGFMGLALTGVSVLCMAHLADIRYLGAFVCKHLDFASIGNRVMRGAEGSCTARSHTFAKRIVNALRKHVPNERGE